MTALNGAFQGRPQEIHAPSSAFDVTRGYVPLLVVCGIVLASVTVTWTVSSYVQDLRAERSAVLARLDKIEEKLDRVISKSLPAHYGPRRRRPRR